MDNEKSVRIESVFPAEIVVRVLITFKSLDKLLNYLDRAVFEFDSIEEPEMAEVSRFVKEEFFPLMDSLSEKIKEDSNEP